MDFPIHQHHLSRAVDQASFNILTDTALDTQSKALGLSSSVHHTGNWLKVVPSKALGVHIQDCDFRLCLQYWMGVQMCQEGSTCPVCQAVTDGFGNNQVECRGNGDLIHQHNSLRDIIFSAVQSAALAPRKEVPYLVSSPSSLPADIFFPCWKWGKPAAFDVTVIYPLQWLIIQGASVTSGYVITVREDTKFCTHLENCLPAGVSFVPLVVESLGGWSNEAINNLRLIGKQQA